MNKNEIISAQIRAGEDAVIAKLKSMGLIDNAATPGVSGLCMSCKHRDTNGYCRNEKLAEERGQSDKEKDDMLIYDYNESGGFWVGEQFGCIHHTPNT